MEHRLIFLVAANAKISGGKLISSMTGWLCTRQLDLNVRQRIATRLPVKMELPHRRVNQYSGMLLLEEEGYLRRTS